ncbi:MAG: pyridoxamine 5'-phosphate oxidase family protein [Nostocales cyanobacterium 94392]|nr:pyridoxamine 5'-phosphate oxidase family protein [Nostocales cyanobacterium 94392]
MRYYTLGKNLEKAKATYALLISNMRTVVLGTVSNEGIPNVSYAPFVIDEAKNIYIFVSKLSVHTSNLQVNGKASVMLIEDETKSKQIFARKRLTYSCHGTVVEKNHPEWDYIADKFDQRFGNIIYIFRNLPDFEIFKFTPYEGLFVMDFGAAYQINADDLNHLVQITEQSDDETEK